MNVLKYRVSLDMFDTHSQTTIKAKKCDSACQIHITLTEKGKIYHIGEGCYATFNAKKSDGNFIYDKCTIENNTIVYDFLSSLDEDGNAQISACEGIVECEITLYNADGEQLTSPRFTLFIDGTVYNGEDVVSTPQANALKELIHEAKDVAEEVKELKNEANSLVSDAKELKDKAKGVKNYVQTIESGDNFIITRLMESGLYLLRAGASISVVLSAIENRQGFTPYVAKALDVYTDTEVIISPHRKTNVVSSAYINDKRSVYIKQGAYLENDKLSQSLINDNTYIYEWDGTVNADGTEYSYNATFIKKEKANTIKLTKSGSVIGFTDIAPDEDEFKIRVKLNSGVSYDNVVVSLCGKNLLQVKNAVYWGGDKLDIVKVNTDGSITLKGTCSSTSSNYVINNNALPSLPPGTYTFSCSNKSLNANAVVLKNGKQTVYTNKPFTLDEGDTIQFLQLRMPVGYTIDETVYVQIESGAKATEYEPYTEPITATVTNQGVVQGITSISNNMTLLSNTNGAIIECTYNADLKKYIDNRFAELSVATLSV